MVTITPTPTASGSGQAANDVQGPLTDEQVDSWRSRGFCLVDGIFDPALVERLRADATARFPMPGSEEAAAITDFGSALTFPSDITVLNQVTLDERLLDAVGQLLDVPISGLRLSQSDLWPKYGRSDRRGGVKDNQDQRIHIDYPNHSLVHPPPWDRPEAVELILYLSNHEETGGATAVVPRAGPDDPAYRWPIVDSPGIGALDWVNDRTSAETYLAEVRPHISDWRDDLYRRELLTSFTPGTVLFYRHDTWHRGTPLVAGGFRLAHNLTFRLAASEWISTLHSGWAWQMYRKGKVMERLIAESTVSQRTVLGFPAPGSPYWCSETLEAVAARATGLGMGVGEEELVSAVAAQGCAVSATDQNPDTNKAKQWDNGQLAAGKDTLFFDHIVDRTTFDRNVYFEHFDMNDDEPRYYEAFDFIWHNCVIGHLGSMEKSIAHLTRSAKYLKDGGWLVFTTEINISSLTDTVTDNSDTIVWRLKDIEDLHERLAEVGLRSDGLKIRMGDQQPDYKVDADPVVRPDQHYRLESPDFYESKTVFSNYALTQIVLCYQKKRAKPKLQRLFEYRRELARNTKVLLDHIPKNPDLQDYHPDLDPLRIEPKMEPVSRNLVMAMKPGETREIVLEFKLLNNSKVFEYGLLHPYNSTPMIMSTADPINHQGKFRTENWFVENRPAASFDSITKDGKNTPYTYKAFKGEVFSYRFEIKAPEQPGSHKESYCLVQEGLRDHASTTTVEVEILVAE